MSYITEIQTIEAFGIPATEYQTQPEVGEQRLITIEFKPPVTNGEYMVEQPSFVFGDIVVLRQEWDNCYLNQLDTDEIATFTVCGMELVETKNQVGQLIDYPYWKLGIRSTDGSKEMIWREEHELVRKASRDLEWF